MGQKSNNDQVLATLRRIVDAGGPQTPVRSLSRPPVMDARRGGERPLPISDEPLAQGNLIDAMGIRDAADMVSDPSNVGLASAPIGVARKLPAIAPEAYKHVKAGGLKLYSRLTDAVAKAPRRINPSRLGAMINDPGLKEEARWRKLNEFLSTQPKRKELPEGMYGPEEMPGYDRQAIMGHLEANPIELDVVRKGHGAKFGATSLDEFDINESTAVQARDAERMFEHELDTRYGPGWVTQQQRDGGVQSTGPIISEEDAARYIELGRARIEAENAPMPHDRLSSDADTRWHNMQTPGPKENYGETLINMPNKASKQTPEQLAQRQYGRPYRELTPDEQQHLLDNSSYYDDVVIGEQNFQSTHVEEPNNMVWTRHNDRRLDPTQEQYLERDWQLANADRDVAENRRVPVDDPRYDEALEATNAARAHRRSITGGNPLEGPKGRFIEELQGDWPQQGRERGYRTPELAEKIRQNDEAYLDPDNEDFFSPYHSQKEWETAVPDMPFKDNYHELALKQQLLDAANDPELEWLGIADADTAMAMEGNQAVSEAGMRHWYDKEHPAALKKLLNPLGGDVGYDNLPGKTFGHPSALGVEANDQGKSLVSVYDQGDGTMPRHQLQRDAVASVIPGFTADSVKKQMTFPKVTPGPGMWKAPLPPELKSTIAERGFPIMALLAALQAQLFNRNGEQ